MIGECTPYNGELGLGRDDLTEGRQNPTHCPLKAGQRWLLTAASRFAGPEHQEQTLS